MAPTTLPQQNATRANLFELAGNTSQVTFSGTSILGGPILSYRTLQNSQTFQGEEIQIEDTILGQLITVTTEHIPDLRLVTFTLVLPAVLVLPQSSGTCISVFGVTTTNPMNIAGPTLGPQKLYAVEQLHGTAQFIVS